MGGGIDGPTSRADVEAGLADLLANAPLDAPILIGADSADRADYIVLHDDGDRVLLAAGGWTAEGPRPDGTIVALGREGDREHWCSRVAATAGSSRYCPAMPRGRR